MKARRSALIVLALILSSFMVFAQQDTSTDSPAQRRLEIDTFTARLLPKVTSAIETESARVTAFADSERSAANDLKNISDEKAKAQQRAGKADQDAAIARTQPNTGGAKSIDMGIYDKQVALAKANVATLSIQEQQARETVERLEQERRAAVEKKNRLEKQRDEVKELYRAWEKDQSEKNFKTLTGFLTEVAAEQNETSDVDLATVDQQKNETKGALIYYETELSRRHHDPVRTSNCTTGCTEKSLPKGWYYMWSVRTNRETSDKNRYVHIKGPTDKVEISENP